MEVSYFRMEISHFPEAHQSRQAVISNPALALALASIQNLGGTTLKKLVLAGTSTPLVAGRGTSALVALVLAALHVLVAMPILDRAMPVLLDVVLAMVEHCASSSAMGLVDVPPTLLLVRDVVWRHAKLGHLGTTRALGVLFHWTCRHNFSHLQHLYRSISPRLLPFHGLASGEEIRLVGVAGPPSEECVPPR